MHQAKHLLRDTIIVIIGNLILAFGVAVFAVPSDLIVAGATGIALIVQNLFRSIMLQLSLSSIWRCCYLDLLF